MTHPVSGFIVLFIPSSRNSVTAIFLYARQCVVNIFICDVGYQLDSRPDFCLSILLYFTRFKLRFRVSNHYTEKHNTGPPVFWNFYKFVGYCWSSVRTSNSCSLLHLLEFITFQTVIPTTRKRQIELCETYK